MAKEDPRKQARPDNEPDQEERIRWLEERAEELGTVTHFEDSDPDLKESFLRNVIEMEEAGWCRPGDLLEEGGIEITPSDQVSDEPVKGFTSPSTRSEAAATRKPCFEVAEEIAALQAETVIGSRITESPATRSAASSR